ncbi:DUF5008 domain-containing protein [Pedobacter changchengzhani]|uniref:DUF5008 domain-containing protein n=1 Tax=Pedobacter changchengzhani TaxID=2529274 RepID=A0A4V3A0A2_9SPHI|nr:DUF5008 domain-containing protein [Pedobacter changchengzhani]TDG36223.1 DUF5008 domain-containing protein [Pedobacter changchengzhani]
MTTKIKNYRSYLTMFAFLVALVVVSCTKEKQLGVNPYDGRPPLGISISTKSIDQTEVSSGESVEVAVGGLKMKDYKDADIKIYVNEILAPLASRTDTTLTFNVPLDASTGSMWITVNNQTFFGPVIKIAGKVEVDDQFKIVNGPSNLLGSNTVFDIEKLPSGKFWLGGAFTDFEQKGTQKLPIGGIVQVDASGKYTTEGIDFGKGVGGGAGVVFTMARIPTGTQQDKVIIGGNFYSFNSTRVNRQVLNSLARLNEDGTLDSIVVQVANPKPGETYKNLDTVPAFNAGVNGFVTKVIPFGDKVYVIGDFTSFTRIFYDNSTYDQKYYDNTKMRQLVRVNEDGSLDSTFHYNKLTRQSAIGANGGISSAIMQRDGKLILVGSFTTFNGTPANRIVRLNLDGSVDNSFNVGSGADNDIYTIRYNENTDQITLAGLFTKFNGKNLTGLNLLNADGSNNTNFVPLKTAGGVTSFAGQLNNGKIIVSGSFKTYGTYLRQGFMILNSDGSLAVGYNNTGGFQGNITDMVETPLFNGTQVTFVGNIQRFNTILPHNVLRIIIKD